MATIQADAQIVAGKRRSVRSRSFVARDQSQDAEGAAELGLAEGGGFGFAEGTEFASAALHDGGGDFAGK